MYPQNDFGRWRVHYEQRLRDRVAAADAAIAELNGVRNKLLRARMRWMPAPIRRAAVVGDRPRDRGHRGESPATTAAGAARGELGRRFGTVTAAAGVLRAALACSFGGAVRVSAGAPKGAEAPPAKRIYSAGPRPPKLKRQTSPEVIVCTLFCVWLAIPVGTPRKSTGRTPTW